MDVDRVHSKSPNARRKVLEQVLRDGASWEVPTVEYLAKINQKKFVKARVGSKAAKHAERLESVGGGDNLQSRDEGEVGHGPVTGDEEDKVAPGGYLPRDGLEVVTGGVHEHIDTGRGRWCGSDATRSVCSARLWLITAVRNGAVAWAGLVLSFVLMLSCTIIYLCSNLSLLRVHEFSIL